MSVQHCSNILRLLVVCGAASIVVVYLSVRHYCPPGSTYLAEHLHRSTSSVVATLSLLPQGYPVEDLQPNEHVTGGSHHSNSGNSSNNAVKSVTLDMKEQSYFPPSIEREKVFDSNTLSNVGQKDLSNGGSSFKDRTQTFNRTAAGNYKQQLPATTETSVHSNISKKIESDTLSDDKVNITRVYSNTTGAPASGNRTWPIPARFLLEDTFLLPWHSSKPVSSIMTQEWYFKFVTFLQKTTPNLPIVLVSSDGYFKSALVNWLIFSLILQEDPVKNLLVLSYDPSICSFIEKRQLTDCLHVPPETLTAPQLYDRRKYGGLYPLLIVRVVMMRILNRLGFDVANFDSDALLLRNPVPVFEQFPESDVIGTYGGGLPGYLLKKWGVVVCMGAIFMRSTNGTESLWEAVRLYKSGDDQIKMNNGIDSMDIKWTTKNLNHTNTSDTLSVLWQATGKDNLKLTLLPQRIACRGVGCGPEVKGQCYIWHHGKNQHKFKNMSVKAKGDGLWVLRKDWENVDKTSSLIGTSWLKEMMIGK